MCKKIKKTDWPTFASNKITAIDFHCGDILIQFCEDIVSFFPEPGKPPIIEIDIDILQKMISQYSEISL